MQQPLPIRYANLRRRGHTAFEAIARARTLQKPVFHAEPFIGPPFPFDRASRSHEPNECYRWVEFISALEWRAVGFADEIISSLRHRGWYADTHYDDVYRGIVYRLPGNRFLFGYADPINPDCALLANCFSADAHEAARSADTIAQRFAERDRSFDEAWHAVEEAVEMRRDARDKVREALADLRELESCDSPRIKTTIRSAFDQAWSRYVRARASLRKILDGSASFGIKASEF